MSLDGSVCACLVYELNNKLVNGKIDKIYQPSKDEILINIRASRIKYKLLLSASGNYPRVHLTENIIDNPSNPPAFCMLLRKHLEGSILNQITQYKMDRIIKFDFSSKDELGLLEDKSLILEIMGKYSNIILVNKDSKILDSLKRINFNKSRVREIVPGAIYNPIDISKGLDPRDEYDLKSRILNADKNLNLKRFLMNTYTGISPQMVMEVSYRSGIDMDRAFLSYSENDINMIEKSFYEIFESIKKCKFQPIKILKNEKFSDFYSIDLKFYNDNEKIIVSSINELLDEFYAHKQVDNRINSLTSNYQKIIRLSIKRTKRKLEFQAQELNEALDRDRYKVYADLISSNFHNIKPGDKTLRCSNYYDNMNEIEIPLDIKLNAQQNANIYYKKYSKLKKAAGILYKQIEDDKALISYLESLLLNISLMESLDDIEDLKEEMQNQGLIKNNKRNLKNKSKSNTKNFLEFEMDGYNIFLGKNNKQNDYLTLKFANKDDYWFHVKEGPGSHVILKNKGDNPPIDVLNACAALAAKYSSFGDSNNVLVDYTKRINIKRHPSNKLGLVIYQDFSTINIKSTNEFLQKLVKKG